MRNLLTPARLIGLTLAAFIAVFDQVTKWYVINRLDLYYPGATRELLPFFDLTYTRNYGISLGMLEATSMEMRWLLIAMTGAIAVAVLVWMMREKLAGDILGLALILGGAIGNIRDRFKFGYVIDFADLHFTIFGQFIRPFLIFNVADAAITIGVVVILARALFLGEKDDSNDTQDGAAGALEN